MNLTAAKPLIFLICILTLISAETKIGGVLNQDTRLFSTDGPFILTSDLVVPLNIRLTISSGVKIIIQPDGALDTINNDFDQIDRKLISIRISGTLSCIGRKDARIVLQPDSTLGEIGWYGIIFDHAKNQFNEIAFTTISGAYCAISVKRCAPVIRRSILSLNQFGIICYENGNANIYNCIIAYNKNSGIRTLGCNASVRNSIIVFNRNNGIWGDGKSRLDISYNCISDNHDGNFINCDPELGVLTRKNRNGDSTDIYDNIIRNPVFTGSVAEAREKERDLKTPTNMNSIKNKVIAAVINITHKDTDEEPVKQGLYHLSSYSPCRNAGDPSSRFKDSDGSRNDIGLHGGPDYLEQKER